MGAAFSGSFLFFRICVVCVTFIVLYVTKDKWNISSNKKAATGGSSY
jgi:hypothetical protein